MTVKEITTKCSYITCFSCCSSNKKERLQYVLSARGPGTHHLKLRLNAQNSHLTSYAYNLFLFDFRYHLGSTAPVVGLNYFTSLPFQISIKLFSVLLHVDSLYPRAFQGHPCHDPCCLPNISLCDRKHQNAPSPSATLHPSNDPTPCISACSPTRSSAIFLSQSTIDL